MTAADEFKSWPLQLQRDCLQDALNTLTNEVAESWERNEKVSPRRFAAVKRAVFVTYQRKASVAKRTADDTRTCKGCYREVVFRVEGTRRVKVDWPEGTLHACTPGEAP